MSDTHQCQCGNPFLASRVISACQKAIASSLKHHGPLQTGRLCAYSASNYQVGKLESIIQLAKGVHGEVVYLTGNEFSRFAHHYMEAMDDGDV